MKFDYDGAQNFFCHAGMVISCVALAAMISMDHVNRKKQPQAWKFVVRLMIVCAVFLAVILVTLAALALIEFL